MSDDASRSRFLRASVLVSIVVAGLVVLLPLAPVAQAHGGECHADDPLGDPGATCPQTSCPADGQLTDDSTSAFAQADASEPEAATQTVVGCSGDYVLKVTTAEDLRIGRSHVAFFSVHNVQSGGNLGVEGMKVIQTGAVGSDGPVRYMSAAVDGAPGLRAVPLQPVRSGQVQFEVQFPSNESVGTVQIPVTEPSSTQNGQTGGQLLPGFEAAALVVGVAAAALLFGRRGGGGAALTVLVAAALVVPPAAAHGGHAGGRGVLEPVVRTVDGGFDVTTDELNATFTATAEGPTLLYDFGDFTTAEGPEATHTYDTAGLYLAQLISYDPATLRGTVHAQTVTPGGNTVNDPPLGVLISDKRWITYGDNITLDASGTTEVNGDELVYLWSVGQAPVDGGNGTFSVRHVTTEPTLDWTAPDEDGDFTFIVFVLDARRGFATAQAQVRVTETLPDDTKTVSFSGELVCPERAEGTAAEDQCNISNRHAFSIDFTGRLIASLNYSDSAEPVPTEDNPPGVPNVDMRLFRAGEDEHTSQEVGRGVPATMDTEVSTKGDWEMEVLLESGAEASYTLDIVVHYNLDPFS